MLRVELSIVMHSLGVEFLEITPTIVLFLMMVIPSVGPKSIMTMMLGGLIVVVLRHAYLKVIGPV